MASHYSQKFGVVYWPKIFHYLWYLGRPDMFILKALSQIIKKNF